MERSFTGGEEMLATSVSIRLSTLVQHTLLRVIVIMSLPFLVDEVG